MSPPHHFPPSFPPFALLKEPFSLEPGTDTCTAPLQMSILRQRSSSLVQRRLKSKQNLSFGFTTFRYLSEEHKPKILTHLLLTFQGFLKNNYTCHPNELRMDFSTGGKFLKTLILISLSIELDSLTLNTAKLCGILGLGRSGKTSQLPCTAPPLLWTHNTALMEFALFLHNSLQLSVEL